MCVTLQPVVSVPRVLKPDNEVARSTAKMRLLKRLKCTLKFEQVAWAEGAKLVAGVDEVGRGSLFGPVVAAAVVLDPAYRIRGLRDSKLLDAAQRERLAKKIRRHAVSIAWAAVDAARIDQINIHWASLQAMIEAVSLLDPQPDYLLLDAVRLRYSCLQKKIIHGDALSCSIAAASIIAKTERDKLVRRWDPVFPVYGLAANKGYYTQHHVRALRQHGPSPLHRQSFAPVWMNNDPGIILETLNSAVTEN